MKMYMQFMSHVATELFSPIWTR